MQIYLLDQQALPQKEKTDLLASDHELEHHRLQLQAHLQKLQQQRRIWR
jgi:hypothetical protein